MHNIFSFQALVELLDQFEQGCLARCSRLLYRQAEGFVLPCRIRQDMCDANESHPFTHAKGPHIQTKGTPCTKLLFFRSKMRRVRVSIVATATRDLGLHARQQQYFSRHNTRAFHLLSESSGTFCCEGAIAYALLLRPSARRNADFTSWYILASISTASSFPSPFRESIQEPGLATYCCAL